MTRDFFFFTSFHNAPKTVQLHNFQLPYHPTRVLHCFFHFSTSLLCGSFWPLPLLLLRLALLVARLYLLLPLARCLSLFALSSLGCLLLSHVLYAASVVFASCFSPFLGRSVFALRGLTAHALAFCFVLARRLLFFGFCFCSFAFSCFFWLLPPFGLPFASELLRFGLACCVLLLRLT
jgi:hypothetical protein